MMVKKGFLTPTSCAKAMLLSTGVLLASCAENPTLFDDSDSLPTFGAPLANYSWADNTTATIVAYDDGRSYTLDLATSEIRRDDGATLVLDASMMADAADAFVAVVETDYMTETPITPPVCRDETCEVDPMSASADSVIIRKATPEEITKHKNDKKDKDKKKDGAFSLTSNYGPCEDIYREWSAMYYQHQNARSSWIKDLFTSVMAGVAIQPNKWAVPTSFAAFVADWASELGYRNIRFGILGTYWNSYDCSSQLLRFYSGMRPGGGGYLRGCVYETWSISFDGGNTWQFVTVQVCHYN